MKLPENIQDFIKIGIIIPNLKPDHKRFAEVQASREISYPLSLVYGLDWLNFTVKDKLVVHIVGCQAEEVSNLTAWEIVLHIYPQIKDLKIFFIGPEISEPFMESETYKIVQMADMCDSCRKILKCEIIKDLYHDFAKSSEYREPDVVCAFHPKFHHHETIRSSPWSQTLPLLLKDSPLIMTAFQEWEMDSDLKILHDFNSNLIVRKKKNPFASLLPARSMEDGAVDYSNNFISVILKR